MCVCVSVSFSASLGTAVPIYTQQTVGLRPARPSPPAAFPPDWLLHMLMVFLLLGDRASSPRAFTRATLDALAQGLREAVVILFEPFVESRLL